MSQRDISKRQRRKSTDWQGPAEYRRMPLVAAFGLICLSFKTCFDGGSRNKCPSWCNSCALHRNSNRNAHSTIQAALLLICHGRFEGVSLSATKWAWELSISPGAKLVVLPENFAFLGEHETAKMAVAEKVPGDRPILTRFAFVCLLGQNNEGQEKSAILERQTRSAWDAPNKPRVFGLSHVRNWLTGNTDDLRAWLES